MKIGRADVEYAAKLGYLKLSEEELEKFTREFDELLSYMEKLNRLDTTGIIPTSHAIPVPNPVREDETRPSSVADELIAAAPERSSRFFKVPRIIE